MFRPLFWRKRRCKGDGRGVWPLVVVFWFGAWRRRGFDRSHSRPEGEGVHPSGMLWDWWRRSSLLLLFDCGDTTGAVQPTNILMGSRKWVPGWERNWSSGTRWHLWPLQCWKSCFRCGMQVWMENPASSWLFRLPEWIALLARWPSLQYWTVDYCRFKMKWRKRTRFALTSDLGGSKDLCRGGHVHQLLRGRSSKHQASWTRVAQPYPKGVCQTLARSLRRAAFQSAKGAQPKLSLRPDPAACAKCTHARIGEATNPGPRRSHRPRLGALYSVPLVEPKTKALQTKVWQGFESWLLTLLSPEARSSAMACPALLVQLLEEYGNVLYQRGAALYTYPHLVVVVQQSIPAVKALAGPCWEMINRWEVAEPPDHRTPLPLSLYKAMMTTALLWKWERFASILGLAFFGIARPGEPLKEIRSSLLLPSDLLEFGSTTAYLKIQSPKTRRRGGGRIQHLTIDEPSFVSFLEAVFRKVPRDEPLFV